MWSDARRPPGSREEDAWLSDEQLRRVAPAETEPFQSPVPTRMVSNGEYMPHPQTKQQQQVEYRIKELGDSAARKLGISRRQFLRGTGGLAVAFIAMNEVFGKKFFDVALAHAQIYPGVGNLADPAFGDYTQWQIDFCQPDSWKGYNVAFAASAFPGAEFT